jgi:hypothetical protein
MTNLVVAFRNFANAPKKNVGNDMQKRRVDSQECLSSLVWFLLLAVGGSVCGTH